MLHQKKQKNQIPIFEFQPVGEDSASNPAVNTNSGENI
jgi:hypothetical protein